MCLPVAIIGAVIAVAGEVVKADAQNKAAKKNKAAARQAEIENFSALDERGRQEAYAAMNQKADAQRVSDKNEGYLATAAAVSGVGGSSVSAVLHQVDADSARYDARVEENLMFERQQIERQKRGVAAQTQDRINSLPPANPFATGLAIAGDVVGAMANNPGAFGIHS